MGVTTRSQTTKSGANSCAHDATQNPPGQCPDTSAVVNRDTARASAANRTPILSKGAKACRALKPVISEEDRHKRARSKATVSNAETNTHSRGPKPTRAAKPRITSQAPAVNKGRGHKPRIKGETSKASDNEQQGQNHAGASGNNKGHGSKPKTKGGVPKDDPPNPCPIRTPTTLSSQSLPAASDDERQGQHQAGASSKRGTKRKRDGEGTSETDVSAARTRRRVDLPTDSNWRREGTMNPASRMDAPVTSRQGLRRSARLASRTSVPNHSLMEEAGHPMIGTQSQCTRQRVREDDENEEAGAQRTRRHTSEPLVKQEDVAESGPATRIEPSERARASAEVCDDDSSLFLVKKEEEIDQTWLLTANAGRHKSVDSDIPTPFLDRGGTAFRSPSVESAAIMTPPPRTGLGTVRIYQDDEAWVPLGTVSEEAEEGGAHDVSLPQLDGSSDDEADEDDVENIFGVDDRRRSLAPEPDEGLLAEIRSGRIPGLASPER